MNRTMIILFCMHVFAVHAGTAYVQVVDEAGTPIPGATVSASWFVRTFFPSALKTGAGHFVCNEQGVTAIKLTGKSMVTLDSAAKEGYVFERYLNLNRDPLAIETDILSNPRRIVLRQLELASYQLEIDSGRVRWSEGSSVEFGVDFFHKIRKEWKIASYDDFFVSARYREKEHRWDTVFWTTNANCGLVATVNRRFIAPETGYVSRVEVSQETFTNKAFTLYLKTRNPTLYAMIPFGLSDLQARGSIDKMKPCWDFHFKVARINPYGGRELERDEWAANNIEGDLRGEALQALLKEHKYPPRPDIVARMENEHKSKVLRIREQTLRNEMYDVIHQLQKERQQFKDNPRKLQEIEKRDKELDAKYLPELKQLNKEIERLHKEAHTLNLPEEKRE